MHALTEPSPALEQRRKRRLRDMERRFELGLPLMEDATGQTRRVPYRPRTRMDIVGTVRGMYHIEKELGDPKVVGASERLFLCRCTKCHQTRHLTFKQSIERICPCSHEKSDPEVKGLEYHWLTVIGTFHKKNNKQGLYVRARCRCGSIIITRLSSLKAGRSKSCGCLQRVCRSEKGNRKSVEYGIWLHLRNGSVNPKASSWKALGAKGLKLCQQWADSFEQFVADVGRKPYDKALYRLDPEKDFEPGNVQWMTKQEHALLNNPLVSVDGVTDTMRGVCRQFDVPYPTVMHWVRIKSLSFADAVRTVRERKAQREKGRSAKNFQETPSGRAGPQSEHSLNEV